jgi:NTP pyrophosphatase (non-canonical NTP hydrolase)
MKPENFILRSDKQMMKNRIYHKAIAKFGDSRQMDICIEEMAELTQAIIKYRRNTTRIEKELRTDVIEEIADVIIMIEQMILIFDAKTEVQKWTEIKLKRLENLIEVNEK